MDAVVVENEMDPTSIAVRRCHQFVKKVQEQEAVLPIAFDPCELAGFLGLGSASGLGNASRCIPEYGRTSASPASVQSGPILGLR